MRHITTLLAVAIPLCVQAQTVVLEDMTSQELRARIDRGMTVALVPIGGTEQSGPHMTLGKHNVRAKELAARIAQRVGNAAVAPVISYVPEGAISPPTSHMKFAGTISISDATFEALLDSTARSLCQHGFRYVFFLGDHGGYQALMQQAANKLTRSGKAARCTVRALREYYDATQTTYAQALRKHGLSDGEIGVHAGAADTSLSMAIDANMVRTSKLAESARLGLAAGVNGDPSRSSAELGRLGVQAIIDASVHSIQRTLASSPK